MAVPRWLPGTFLAVSFLGFLDAAFLTVEHFRGVAPACGIGGCEAVTTSRYAEVFGVPIALLGALYYLAVFLLTFSALTERREAAFRLAARLTVLGFLASLVLVSIMAFALKAWCLYCLGSAASSTVLFGASLFLPRRPSPPPAV